MKKLLIILLLASCTEVKDFPTRYEYDEMHLYTNKPSEVLTDGIITRNEAKTKIIKDSKIVTVLVDGYFEGYQVLKLKDSIVFESYIYGNNKKTFNK